MHCKSFYYKNALQFILQEKCIANYFTQKSTENYSIIKNALQIILS